MFFNGILRENQIWPRIHKDVDKHVIGVFLHHEYGLWWYGRRKRHKNNIHENAGIRPIVPGALSHCLLCLYQWKIIHKDAIHENVGRDIFKVRLITHSCPHYCGSQWCYCDALVVILFTRKSVYPCVCFSTFLSRQIIICIFLRSSHGNVIYINDCIYVVCSVRSDQENKHKDPDFEIHVCPHLHLFYVIFHCFEMLRWAFFAVHALKNIVFGHTAQHR